MKLSKKSGGDFQPHPETEAPTGAVIVDVTPLKTMHSQHGDREVFKLVFETSEKKADGSPCCVWSRPYTPSLHEKAAFRKDLKKILGRELTAQEEEDFDTESLIGTAVSLMVEHQTSDKGEIFANVSLLMPYKGTTPPKASGKFVRAKDREQKDGKASGEKASYRKTPEEEGRDEWQKCKVHVGKNAGVDLGDLDPEAVTKLIENWLPKHKTNEKPKADDRRLAAALEEAQKLLTPAAATEEF